MLVYYSYQPYSNSALEDFADASAHAYRVGKPTLAIGLPLFVLSLAALIILSRKDKPEEEPDPDREKGSSKSDDVPRRNSYCSRRVIPTPNSADIKVTALV